MKKKAARAANSPARGRSASASKPVGKPRGIAAGGKRTAPADRRASRQDALAMTVLGQFRLIFRSAKIHFQWVQDRSGVSGSQLWVLAEIRRRPGIRVTELAQAMAVHQSTASNLVESLEGRGLLRRERSNKDQRVVQLFLSSAGRQSVARAPEPLRGVLPDALHSLDHRDLTELKKYLDRLADVMKVHDRQGRRIPLAEI